MPQLPVCLYMESSFDVIQELCSLPELPSCLPWPRSKHGNGLDVRMAKQQREEGTNWTAMIVDVPSAWSNQLSV